MKGSRLPLAYASALWLGLALWIAGLGAHALWSSFDDLPTTYSRLREQGIPASARLVECARGLGGGRGRACRLTLTLGGQTTTWVYPEDSAQFERLPQGAAVPMLVDPADLRTAYTVYDVHQETNAGWSPTADFGMGCLVASAAMVGLFGRLIARLAGRFH